MEKAAQEVQTSRKLKFVIVYLAVITTLSVFTVGYNQHVTCETQKFNVIASNTRNEALDTVIGKQVSLYEIVLDGVDSNPLPPTTNEQAVRQAKFADTLKTSINDLRGSRHIIKDTPSQPVQCFLVG